MMSIKKLRFCWITGGKQCFTDVSVEDLVAHFTNNELAKKVISEALSFSASNCGNLRFWGCCLCTEKFDDSELHIQHVKGAHMKNSLAADLSSLLPVRVNSDWKSMILSGTWKPVDVSAAVTIIGEQLDIQHFKGSEAFEAGNRNPTTDDRSFVIIPDKLKKHRIQKWAREYTSTCSWPLSDDIERYTMLSRIQNMLEELILNESLAQSHVDRMITYAQLELECTLPYIDVHLLCLTETHVCICFLGAPQLQIIINLLEEITRFAARHVSDKDDNDSMLSAGTKGRSFLKGDSLCIFLVKPPGGKTNSNEDYLESWTRIRKERQSQEKELLKTLDEKYGLVSVMLASKDNRLIDTRSLEFVWFPFFDEICKRMCDDNHVPQSYEAILEKIKRIDWGSHITKAISDIFEEAQSTTPQTLVDVPVPYFFDVEHFGKGYSKQKIEADNDTVNAVKRLSQNIDMELIKSDARILQLQAETKKIELKIKCLSDFDYRAVLLPLVKSYVKASRHGLEVTQKVAQ